MISILARIFCCNEIHVMISLSLSSGLVDKVFELSVLFGVSFYEYIGQIFAYVMNQ